jgi:AP endonuclease-2
MLDEPTAFIDGYTSYFSFSRKKTGYSGVATFCKTDFTPIQAGEGLGSTLPSSSNSDNIGCNENILQEFSLEELKSLDSEGRCVITQHQIQTEGDNDNVKKLAVINVYCPQDRGGERLEYQLKFYKLLEMRAVT